MEVPIRITTDAEGEIVGINLVNERVEARDVHEPIVDVQIGARGFADTKVKINGHEVHPSSLKVEISANTNFRPIVTLVFARRVRFEVAAKAWCNLMATEEEVS